MSCSQDTQRPLNRGSQIPSRFHAQHFDAPYMLAPDNECCIDPKKADCNCRPNPAWHVAAPPTNIAQFGPCLYGVSDGAPKAGNPGYLYYGHAREPQCNRTKGLVFA